MNREEMIEKLLDRMPSPFEIEDQEHPGANVHFLWLGHEFYMDNTGIQEIVMDEMRNTGLSIVLEKLITMSLSQP